MKKPAFIDPIQRIHARVMRVAKIDPAATSGPDGTFPVDHFQPGLCEMAEEDWRQFRMTPENALAMVNGVNATIAAGKQIRGNYAHDRSGPICADVVRAEVTPGGGVRSFVKWSARAQAAIRPDANGVREYEGTSPEFRARVVLDEDGDPLEENGRVLMEPFELSGFALDNDPAMPDLGLAATTESEAPEQGKEATVDMKKLASKLGLPETASAEDVEKALDLKLKPAPAPAAAPPLTVEAIVEAVLAKIDPDKLSAGIMDGAVAKAKEAIRAENHEAECVAAVDGAIRTGRVKKSERDQALKLAKADLESFKTMTASMKLVAPVVPLYQPSADSDGKSPTVPNAPHPSDFVGASLDAFSEEGREDHTLAMAYIEKAHAAGKTIKYRDALIAVTRK